MDRSWIHKHRCSREYQEGAKGFIERACFRGATIDGRLKCPCPNCNNVLYQTKDTVFEHMVCDGFDPSYKIWFYHGEDVDSENSARDDVNYVAPDDHSMGVEMGDLVNDVLTAHNLTTETDSMSHGTNIQPNSDVSRFEKLLRDSEQELYPGCKRHTKLSCILRLFHIKCLGGCSNKTFILFLELLKELLPDGSTLPDNFSQIKKIISDLGLNYDKIDACPNDCMLYWKESATKQSCGTCGMSRWKFEDSNSEKKRKKRPAKILRYFPLKPRLQRLFMSPKLASDMRWHHEGRTKDERLRHPADSPAWVSFDIMNPEFAKDSRNVRLGLASDGFNPFRTMNITHSTWPVILIPYNLPPWLCMKQPNMILSCLIPGPSSPGNDIDVYLRPLIDELKEIWDFGLDTYDASRKETFKLRAGLLWTISDFPGYAMLSGWSTKGRFACPSCHKDTCSRYLSNGRKQCYMGHRRFLSPDHRFRKQKKSFDGTQETREAPIPLDGFDILEELRGTMHTFGKKVGKQQKSTRDTTMPYNWKKKSIFFELPYWKYNLLRHNLDVMHIEKNFCDNVLGTLLNIEGKSKDGLKARLDLVDMRVRHALHPYLHGDSSKASLPTACFSMNRAEKDVFLKVLKSLKVPDGYSSNIARRINLKEGTIYGLKSHDYHVIMQQFLPIAIRRVLSKNVASVLIELSNFFRGICSKTCQVDELGQLTKRVALILCNLERIFPPAFFDVMVHLPIHLAAEAMVGGPVHYRWMYPIERYLCTLKSYVRNKAQPEGSIAEGYIAEECLTFCSRYFQEVETRLNRPVRTCDESVIGGVEPFRLSHIEWIQAHRYVTFNNEKVANYIKQHSRNLRMENPRVGPRELQKLQNEKFTDWFRSHVDMLKSAKRMLPEEIELLAQGPYSIANRLKGYAINGYRFCTVEKEKWGKSQNSGVAVNATTTSYASAKDKAPMTGNLTYYGRLTDIIELKYSESLKFVLFKCDWVDVGGHGKGMKIDEFGFTLVNFNRLLCSGQQVTDEPFVLASQAEQVFYVQDPIDEDWNIVMKTKPRDLFDMDGDGDSIVESEPYGAQIFNDLEQSIDDSVNWAREDMPAATVDAPPHLLLEQNDLPIEGSDSD